MKIAFLLYDEDHYSNARLIKIAKDKGHEVKIINPLNYSYNKFLESKEEFDLCFTRLTSTKYDDFSLSLIKLAQKRSKLCINPLASHLLLRDKREQFISLLEANLPVVPFYSFRGKFLDSDLKLMKDSFSDLLINEEYILKPERGNQGKGVMLIKGDDSLKSILDTFYLLKDQKWIINPFIKGATEYRIFSIKGHGPIFLKKSKETSFKGNFSQGAYSKLLEAHEIPSTLLKLALDLSSFSKAYYFASDILLLEGKPFILEVNNVPGFRELEETFSLDIASKLLSLT